MILGMFYDVLPREMKQWRMHFVINDFTDIYQLMEFPATMNAGMG